MGALKDRIESQADKYVDHDNLSVENLDWIDTCLSNYRDGCRRRMDKEISGDPDSIRKYAKQKLTFPQLKRLNDLTFEFKTNLENQVRGCLSKIE